MLLLFFLPFAMIRERRSSLSAHQKMLQCVRGIAVLPLTDSNGLIWRCRVSLLLSQCDRNRGSIMTLDILAHIQENLPAFSKGQKLIANYILHNYDKAAFMTASRLGKTVNVSESTVVRFAAELGFDGYPSMQKALQEMIRNKLTSVQRMEVSNDRIGNQDVLSMVMHSDMDKIRITLEETDRESFSNAVEAICSARNLYILGVRSASVLANFLSFYFQYIFERVVNIDTVSISEVFEQTIHVDSQDVFIGLSFPRPDGQSLLWSTPEAGGLLSSQLQTATPPRWCPLRTTP